MYAGAVIVGKRVPANFSDNSISVWAQSLGHTGALVCGIIYIGAISFIVPSLCDTGAAVVTLPTAMLGMLIKLFPFHAVHVSCLGVLRRLFAGRDIGAPSSKHCTTLPV